ncbi:MAG: ABC-2 family transporter protein [Anaerolineales bacterium]|nr:ABC-2 family transporter protein [Anaerolineales bacterium]
MNHRGGWALIKSSWLSWMQYSSFFFILVFGWMITPLIYMLVWSGAAGTGTLGGLTSGEFIAYYLILILVNQLTYSQTNWTVGDVIRMGDLNHWLLRPMLPLYNPLANEVAGKVVTMIFVIPIASILAVVLRPELHTTWDKVVLSLLALAFAWLLRFFWGYWLALLAFWTARADALLALQDSLVFLMAGIVAPVWMLPAGFKLAASVLPFRFMVGFPVEILLGQISRQDLLIGFVYQAIWAVFAILLSAFIWRLGIQRYTAVGG